MLPIYKKIPVRKDGKPDLVAKLDMVFSKYIRLRDAMPSGVFKCISCGKIKRVQQMDCGHFWGRMHMATRYDEDNCHGECRYCNRMDSSHLIGYQTNLIKKISIGRFELLSVKARQTKKWSDFELEAMIRHYTAEVERLSREKGIKL